MLKFLTEVRDLVLGWSLAALVWGTIGGLLYAICGPNQ
jgi:hypothetical protein